MEAIKTVQRVKNQQVLIHVPGKYENAEVEVIVLLVNSENRDTQNKKEAFLAFLRNGPTLSEEEINNIETVAQEFQKWTIQEF
jgi:hypothetical protein